MKNCGYGETTFSLGKQSKTILPPLAMMLLFANMAAAQTAVNTAALTFNGSAKLLTGPQGGSVLWLTPAQVDQAGSVFTTDRVVFNRKYAFTTFFQFQMTDPGSGGASDGMTFVLQAESVSALGASGGCLGYAGYADSGCGTYTGTITPSIAVEFDTWQNVGVDYNDNHVGILTDGEFIEIDPQTPYGVTNCQPTGAFGCMSNGDIWSVWIDYDGANLNVALADNSTTRPANIISYPIDIPALFGENSAFVGFTAGTGAGYENHYILNWQFIAAPPA
jgi:hypothetical protein